MVGNKSWKLTTSPGVTAPLCCSSALQSSESSVVMNDVWNVAPHTEMFSRLLCGVGESVLEFDTVKGGQGSMRPDGWFHFGPGGNLVSCQL